MEVLTKSLSSNQEIERIITIELLILHRFYGLTFNAQLWKYENRSRNSVFLNPCYFFKEDAKIRYFSLRRKTRNVVYPRV